MLSIKNFPLKISSINYFLFWVKLNILLSDEIYFHILFYLITVYIYIFVSIMENQNPNIQIITKKNCGSCKSLKHWLKEEKIPFEEWEIEKKETLKMLLNDPQYNAKFCDIDSCSPHIPAIRIRRTGNYFFTGLDGIWDVYNLQKIIREQS